MNVKTLCFAIITLIIVTIPAFSEPVGDRLMGTVTIRHSGKLDKQSKKEIAAIAVKIKKARRNGTVKLIGNISFAESQDEYLSKSVFLSRNVEANLKPLLSSRFQIFITASKFSGNKSAAPDSVEIHLYPHELKTEGAGFVSSQVKVDEVPMEKPPVIEPPTQTVVETSTDSGLLSPIPTDKEFEEGISKKERQSVESENPALAIDLVARAKARAAEKAKLLERLK